MRIALDAMGGDYAPEEIINGAFDALDNFTEIDKIFLVGQEEKILPLLKGENVAKLEVVNAREIISMNDHPSLAYRRKKNASITVATKIVKDGEAQAVVSAGSTGAQMVAALFGLGRIKGVERPAIATILPTLQGGRILLDAGANADCKVSNLLQFAIMGSVYAHKVLGIKNPKVALINIGAEKTKGNELSIKAYEELSKLDYINFVGNIEGREIPQGTADVMVCDGFVGNIILKVMEGMGSALSSLLKEEIDKSIKAKLGAGLMLPALKGFKSRMDYSEYGGAPLLGVDGVSIICHGSSKKKAIYNALRVAIDCHQQGFLEDLKKKMQIGEVL